LQMTNSVKNPHENGLQSKSPNINNFQKPDFFR
jgi:hypothetical protein